jgi:hypothetical protein
MIAGADSIEDMALLRHGAMGKVFDRPRAPSTLGSFLRCVQFGHVRQLDAVAARVLAGAAAQTPVVAGVGGPALVDIDDTIVQVHGYTKQGAGFGYTEVRGPNALLATVSTGQTAPVIVAQRLRKGGCGLARGAARLVADALANLTRAAATLTGPRLAKATTATIRRTLITVPARIACSARRLTLHLPVAWPWENAWTQLFTHTCGPPPPAAA